MCSLVAQKGDFIISPVHQGRMIPVIHHFIIHNVNIFKPVQSFCIDSMMFIWSCLESTLIELTTDFFVTLLVFLIYIHNGICFTV